MGVSPDIATREVVRNTKGETGPGGLPRYLEAQQSIPIWRSGNERKQAFREMVSGEDRTVSDQTFDTYARVLTNEFFSLQEAIKLDPSLSANLPKWQKNLIEAVSHEFTQVNGDYQYDANNKRELFDAYHSMLDQLLRSKDPDKAQQWLVTAMLTTQRQIMALQLATGAQAKVIHEADEIKHVDEPEAFAAAISQDTGVPLDQVSGDLGKLGKVMRALGSKFTRNTGFIMGGAVGLLGGAGTDSGLLAVGGGAAGRLAADVLGWWYRNDPGRRLNWDDAKAIESMWSQYETESRKRIHSDVKIEFAQGGVFRTDRAYELTGPRRGKKKHKLDPVQQAYLRQFDTLATVQEGDALGVNVQRKVSLQMKKMLHAQQDAYFVHFDEQLRTTAQLNLLQATSPDTFTPYPPSGSVNPQIDGMPLLMVGIDSKNTIEKQLHMVTDALIQGVTQERFDIAAKGELAGNVKDQITTLDARVAEIKLTEEKEAKKTELTTKKTTTTAQLQEIETYTQQDIQLNEKSEKITRLTAETAHIQTAKEEVEKAETSMREKTVEKEQKEREAGRVRAEIEELRTRKATLQGEISQHKGELANLKAQFESNTITLQGVNNKIQEIQAYLDSNPPTDANQAQLLSHIQEKQALVAQRLTLTGSLDAYLPNVDRINASITEKENSILDTTTGIDATIRKKLSDLEGSNGLEHTIRTLENEIANANKTKTEQQAVIASGEAQLAELRTLQSEKAALEAKQTAILEALQRGRGLGSALTAVGLAKLKTEIQEEIKGIERDIGIIDSDLEITRLGETHQKEVLEVFRDEFLTSEKWDAIKRRARRPLSAQADLTALERPDSFSHLAIGTRNRPFVMPAYLRMMQIVGGDEILGRSSENQILFAKISKVVTPELFFKVYIQNPARADSIAQALFGRGAKLPADFNVYSDALQNSPTAMRSMVPFIDRHFTQELLKELTRQVNDRSSQTPGGLPATEATAIGKLGRLDDVTLRRMREMSEMEKTQGIKKDELETMIKDAENGKDQARYERRLTSLRRKAETAKAVQTFVMKTLKITDAEADTQIPLILDVVHQIVIENKIMPDARFDPAHVAAAITALAGKSITLTGAQIQTLLVQLRPLEMLPQDYQALRILEAFDTEVVGWGINKLQTHTVDTHMRRVLALVRSKGPIEPSKEKDFFDTQIEGRTLREIIKTGILDLQVQINKPLPNNALNSITDTQLATIANIYLQESAAKTLVTEPQGTAISEVTHRFLARGGAPHEGILLPSFIASLDRASTEQIEQAMYRLESTTGGNEPTIDQIIAQVQNDTLRDYLKERYKDFIVKIVAKHKQNKSSFTGTTLQEIPIEELKGIPHKIVFDGRKKGVGNKRLSFIRGEEVRALGAEVDLTWSAENTRRQIDVLGRKFWGESGRSLAIAIEQYLGGETHRHNAIAYAHAIEARRAKG